MGCKASAQPGPNARETAPDESTLRRDHEPGSRWQGSFRPLMYLGVSSSGQTTSDLYPFGAMPLFRTLVELSHKLLPRRYLRLPWIFIKKEADSSGAILGNSLGMFRVYAVWGMSIPGPGNVG
jgi:hypothetical protein